MTAENIQIVIDETKRLTKLVNDALDLSKLQSGTFNFKPVVFCITDEASDIVTQFEKLSAGKTDIRFESNEDIYVNADEVLVSEAIYNLINNAVIHGAIIEDDCLIGMGATILDNAVVGTGCIVAANALVLSNQKLEPNSVYAGVPAKKVKDVTPEQREQIIKRTARDYRTYASWYE